MPADAPTDLSPSAAGADTWTGVPGRVRIGDDVVAQVVGLTVLECYGVVGMAAKRLVDGVAKLLGRETQTMGVVVTRGAADLVAVELYVVMEHGLNLAEVADNLRARVTYQVERLTGLVVSSLEIHIQGVRRTEG